MCPAGLIGSWISVPIFTVYGPWGRPDMAYFKFTRAILAGEPIDVYNHGNMRRDFTYIDDIVKGVVKVMEKPPVPADSLAEGGTSAPYSLYNIGNNQPVELIHFIEVLEDKLGKKAVKNMLPMQPGDVPETFADIDSLVHDTGFTPSTSIDEGVESFVRWYTGLLQITCFNHYHYKGFLNEYHNCWNRVCRACHRSMFF